MTHELTHLDLFSGIGGFALAAGWAGFRTVGFSEVEPYARRVLAERWPGVPNAGDIRTTENFARFRGCTVLTGGFPCQPWSSAGKRRGSSDDRHLWPAMARVIETVRPAWVVAENVFELVIVGLEEVMLDLESLGYSAQPIGIPACAVDACHIRKRIWILAHDNRDRMETRELRKPKGALCTVGNPGSANVGKDRVGTAHLCSEKTALAAVLGDVHGIPEGSYRVKGLGNAIVPQIPEAILCWIAQIERGEITA